MISCNTSNHLKLKEENCVFFYVISPLHRKNSCYARKSSRLLVATSTMFVIEDKVALITGGLGGIGRAYAKELLREGARGVSLVDINSDDEFIKELEQQFGTGKCIIIKADLKNIKDFTEIFDQTVNHFAQLDIVINNAGICDEIDTEKCIKINLVAPINITKMAFEEYLPKFKKDTEGVVINTSSIAGLHAVSFFPTYSATKYGVLSLAHSFGSEEHYSKNFIKIMTICPARTETNFMGHLNNLPENLKDIVTRRLEAYIPQSPESVGEALIKVLKEGKTGSTWVVEHGKPAQEVDYVRIFEIIKEVVESPLD